MTTGSQRWVAPLTPAPNLTVDNLLELLSGIDVWERHMGYLVAAASDLRLADFEARGLAQVERLYTKEDVLCRHSAARQRYSANHNSRLPRHRV